MQRALGLKLHAFERKAALDAAARASKMDGASLRSELKPAGRAVGSPWRDAHIVASAGALAALRA